MTTISLTEQEGDLLMMSLETWENEPTNKAMMETLINRITGGLSSEDFLKKAEEDMREAQEERKRRARIAVLLKAKLLIGQPSQPAATN